MYDKDGLWLPALPERLKSIHRESIRIYTAAFRTSPVEANDPPTPGTKKKRTWTKTPVYIKKQHLIHTHTEQQWGPKLQREWKDNKPYRCVHKEIKTKIYGGTERDRRDEPYTTTPMVSKQHIILLKKRKAYGNWQLEKVALFAT